MLNYIRKIAMLDLASHTLHLALKSLVSLNNRIQFVKKLPAQLITTLKTSFTLGNESANRQHICYYICIAMMVIMLIQSLKLVLLDDYYSTLLHLGNLSIHFVIFAKVIIYLKADIFDKARNLLIIGFCSYLSLACLLWEYDLGVQYYFLLALFISIYLIGRDEKWRLVTILSFELLAFIGFSMFLPQLSNPLVPESHKVLHAIAQTNKITFALSCCICALFIRLLLSKNWHTLRAYKVQQAQLINHMLPEEIAEALLIRQGLKGQIKRCVKSHKTAYDIAKRQDSADAIYQRTFKKNYDYELEDTSLCQRSQMAVLFIDICGFTSSLVNNEDACRKSTYLLFSQIDLISESFDAKRVKTNGDQYILIVGMQNPDLSTRDICEQSVLLSKQIITLCRQQAKVSIRVGLAFGEVVFGVFDINKPAFDIWGETVVRASRLEARALPNEILVDESIQEALHGKYQFGQLKELVLKGIGKATFFSLSV